MSSCIDVAKLFLSWANRDGDLITNLKIQKLLYYAQAWHLVHFKKNLFDEPIVAWELGPVVPVAYKEFKRFSFKPIEYKKNDKEEKGFTKEKLSFLNNCYSTFIKFPAHDLVNMSHNEDPWKIAYSTPSKIISYSSMQEYYSELLKKQKNK